MQPPSVDVRPVSHRAGSATGVLVVHGFTGNPFSVSGVSEAVIAAGYDVEAPCLPGHGTVIDDMLTTDWSDWFGEVRRAHGELSGRVDRVVACGQSMGATLVLALALEHPELAALACINPLTRPRDPEELAMIDELIEDGLTIVPGAGSDIADPDGIDGGYGGTPLAPVRSLLSDGVAPISDRFGELAMPLVVMTSRQDHVVPPADSEHLVATYGGAVDHVWLERSYHVATRDYDRDLVEQGVVDLVASVATS